MTDREKRIEDLVCRFPTLFDIPEGYQLLRQHQYPDASQADVVFRWASSSLVVEVKKVPVTVKHIEQLHRYLRAEYHETQIRDVSGLLLARISTNHAKVVQAIEELKVPITVRYLESDFSLQVRYCRNCSNPFWPIAINCPHCCSTDHVMIDFSQNRDSRAEQGFR